MPKQAEPGTAEKIREKWEKMSRKMLGLKKSEKRRKNAASRNDPEPELKSDFETRRVGLKNIRKL